MSTQIFNLPDLGEGLTEADLVNWLVEEGETIAVDQPIAEVETAKALVEVPSPYAGTVITLHGKPGETLFVGNPLITVGDESAQSADQPGALEYREEEQAGIAVPDDEDNESSGSVLIGYGTTGGAATGRTRARKHPSTASNTQTSQSTDKGGAPRVISPIVRQLAKRNNIDVAQLTGSGQDGIITRADVLAATEAQTDTPQTETSTPAAQDQDARSGLTIVDRVPMTGVRKMVAEQMVRSRTNIPEATAWLDVDVTELIELRARLKADDPETAPSLLALIARFTTAALRRYPVMNSRIVETDDGEEIVYFDGINLGLAAQTPRGLVVPAIEHAQRLSARELTTEIGELVAKARDGQCTPAELTRGTFTLNNYGVFGTDGAAAIINTPEVAILGVGRIMDRPWVVDGEIMARKVTELTLSFDHRVTDGGTASAFLTSVADAMHHPASALADL
ncbi:dihydrolipoamide acetyltransferase family protein [Yaniella halotolerans]|uniref:dihydrolipoamide acetyltransferase family protein n=1 Tax=Yaniella halotolerans TaxID=225453 RepID=UPI0003B6544A|nr:dihydrolipoamide acetyltransferase family protein [Yaniella halotolerans]